MKHVDWIRGSVLEPPSWRHSLKDVQGVISCVGAFGSYETMKRVCGDANVTAVKTAAEEGELSVFSLKDCFARLDC